MIQLLKMSKSGGRTVIEGRPIEDDGLQTESVVRENKSNAINAGQ